MPWDNTRPGSDPKYRTAEHRQRRAALVQRLSRGEVLECRALVCLMPTRAITNPDGRAPDGLNLGHCDDGVTYRGEEHRMCNVHDGAVRGNAKKRGVIATTRWVL